MNSPRLQLSLFVPDPVGQMIEAVRQVVDPIQHSLIPAHVTLCREDELADFPGWAERLRTQAIDPLTLTFGLAEVFSGHGLMLPCIAGHDDFRQLRQQVLGTKEIRDSQPHLTLAHPRNPKATGNTIDTASALPERIVITFTSIRLIEQVASDPWRVVECYD